MSSIPVRKTLRFITVRKEGGERLPATLHKEINDNLDLTFDPTKIVAMHRIPGKQGAPRPILLNFFKNGL
jgi:hypothetical protein